MMHRVLTMTKLDFYTMKSAVRLSIILYALCFVIGVATKLPEFTLALAMFMTMFIGGTVFGNQESGHGDVLYAILPIRKSEMVAGRFIYSLIVGVAGAIIATVLCYLGDWIRNAGLSTWIYIAVISVTFAYYCFATAIMYPIYYRFGFSKSYIFTMLPLYLIALAALLVVKKVNMPTIMSDFKNWFSRYESYAPLMGLVIGLVFLVIGALVSYAICRHQESSLGGTEARSVLPLSRFGIK